MTENKSRDFSNNNNYIWLVWLFIIAFVAAVISWFESRPVNKSALAKRYGVSVKTLMKWIEIFCPNHIVDEYVGSKKQKIRPQLIAEYFGDASDYPKDKKDRTLNNRQAIQRAFDIGQDTISRYFKALENPEQEIGMTLDKYKRLHTFPPKYSLMLVDSVQKRYTMKR